MKSSSKSLACSMMIMLLAAGIQAQESKPGERALPDEKWDVKKEYDEHGNLIYSDSSYSRTWKYFGHPECGAGQSLENLDSVFKSFFKCEDTLFQFHPFTFAPYRDFMDSLDLDFYLDSSLFLRPHGFRNFRYFPDTAWMDSFLPDSLFPDAYIPFFEVPKFHFPQDFFEKHHEWMERFFEGFTFPDDSLHRFHPKWQQLHRRQKKSAQGLEI